MDLDASVGGFPAVEVVDVSGSAVDAQDMPTPALAHWRESGRDSAGEGMAPFLSNE